jgi:WD40 repeat protein
MKLAAVAGTRVVIWDREKGVLGKIGNTLTPILTAEFSKDGKRLAMCTLDNQFRVLSVEGGELKLVLRGPHQQVRMKWNYYGPAFAKDGQELVAFENRKLVWWDLNSGKQIRTVEVALRDAMTGSPDGKFLAVNVQEEEARLYDLATGEMIHTLGGSRIEFLCFQFSADGKLLCGGGGNNVTTLWSLADEKQRQVQLQPSPAPNNTGIRAMNFSPDGRRIATVAYDGWIRVWELPLAKTKSIRLPNKEKTSIDFSSDSRHLLLRDSTGAQVYQLADGTRFGTRISVVGTTILARFAPDGKRVFTLSRMANGAAVFDAWDWQSGTRLFPSIPLDSYLASLAIPQEANTVALYTEKQIQLCDMSGKILWQHQEATISPRVWFSDNDALIYVTSRHPGHLRAINARTGELVHSSVVFPAEAITWNYFPSGDLLGATSVSKGTIRLFNPKTGEPLPGSLNHPSWPYLEDLSHGTPRMLLSACKDGQARVWDLNEVSRRAANRIDG